MRFSWKMVAATLMLLFVAAVGFSAGQGEDESGELVFGYVTPGPDTWYRRNVDGFVHAAEMMGIETVVLNSEYDAGQEVSNIDSLITQGVDGMAIFSFNPQGAIVAAERAQEAGIPLVTIDNVGQVLQPEHSNLDAVAAVDFDWEQMGYMYADYMAENYPGARVAVIAGLLEHRPVQIINEAMSTRMQELGQNEIVEIRDGEYNPIVAVDQAQDLIQSGLEFDIIWIMNEDMAAAVIRYLEGDDLLDDYTVIAQNGSPAGIELVNQGKLDYTLSSSPGWEGMVGAFALYDYVSGNTTEMNQQIMLPVTEVTEDTIDDPMQVVPWEVDPVWNELTEEYFPEYASYLSQ
ncbi:MAG: sugar ABC transporter substrate-binding protein [Alkalispirochaeta sp.]